MQTNLHTRHKKRILWSMLVASLLVTAREMMASSFRVIGWGDNTYGQVTLPAGLTNVTTVAANWDTSAAVKSDGTIAVWGRMDPQYGDPPNFPATNQTGVVAISVGAGHILALRTNGTVVAWGYNGQGQTNVPAGLKNVKAIAAGQFFSAALKDDGTVVMWGGSANEEVPPPPGLNGVTAISAGTLHTLALRSNGTVVAWGNLGAAQTGVPKNLSGVKAIAAAGYHNLALKTNGTVVAWNNGAAEDFEGESHVPEGLDGVIGLAASAYSSGAIRTFREKAIELWGYTRDGLGKLPPGLHSVRALALGRDHGLALYDADPPIHRATAVAEVTNGFVVGIKLTDSGYGYTNAPSVEILEGGGQNARAVAFSTNGFVSSIKMLNAGKGYSSEPIIRIGPPAIPPILEIGVIRKAVDLKLTIGNRYQLLSSKDQLTWTPLDPPFVAIKETLTKEYDTRLTGEHFRIIQVP